MYSRYGCCLTSLGDVHSCPPIYYVPIKGLRMGVNPHHLAKSASINPLMNPILPTQHKQTCRHSKHATICPLETWLPNSASVTPPSLLGAWQLFPEVPAKPSNVGTNSTQSFSQPLWPRITVQFLVIFTGFKTF